MASDRNRASATDADGLPVRVVLLDALGTLVGLQAPPPHLRAALARRGIDVDLCTAETAVRAEMAHYRAEHHRGGTPEGLRAMRQECATLIGATLGPPAEALDDTTLLEVLLESLCFFAYPEVPQVLRTLRAAGLRLVVCSNWDLSLREVLTATGLDVLVDGVVISAVEGVAKPDPELVRRALVLGGSGVKPAAAVLVGDSVASDVRAARAAGVRPVLVQRSGDEVRSADEDAGPDAVVDVIPDLSGLERLVLYPRRSR